jgi:hypothetical protein
MPSPIHLHTVADLLSRDHTLQLYCLRCDRWHQAPLEQLARRGLADRPITALRFRCARCGNPAQRQLRPPELPPATGTGWMEWPPPVASTAIDSEPGRRIQRPHY